MHWRLYLSITLFAFASPLAIAQEKTDPPKSETPAKEEVLDLADGKIVAIKPEAWKSVQPKSNMIQYEFRTPAEGEKSVRITIMSAGGSIESNIDRWIGQFEGTKKDDTKVEKKEIESTTLHTVEIAGTFKESMGGPFAPGGGKVTKMENYKMLGAILELKDGAKVFIKATGPADLVGDMKENFMKMLEAIKVK
jgi:hypothetical protein